MVLLKNFSVILVYTSYSLFNYIRESSSIWSYTHTFLQNTKGKGVGHETKIVGLRDLHYIRLDTPNFVTHGCAYDPPCFGCSRVLASVSQQCLCLREKYLDPILRWTPLFQFFWANIYHMVWVRRPVDSLCPVCNVGVLWQTVGWIKVPLGAVAGLVPGHIVLDGDPAPRGRGHNSPHFLALSIVAKRLPISATAELLL